MTDTVVARASSISLRQLRLFESVGRLQSIRRASEECNLSQPAVTQALAKLETQIGLTLLDRGTSGSYLNPLGLIFHRRVLRFFEQVERAVCELGVAEDAAAAAAVARRLTRSQIRSFLGLMETSSFADAARVQGLSQASVQRASHDLERNLETQLYCRAASGIIATPGGVSFARRLTLANQELEAGLREIEAALGNISTKIVIGAMPGGGSVLLASVLDEFIETYPRACIRIASGNASELLTSLLCGNADLVIGLIPDRLHDELLAQPLAGTPYEVVARRGHRLLHQGEVTLADLAKYDWIAGTPCSSRRALFDQMFAGTSRPPTPIATCAMPVIRHLLGNSNRLTLMTSYERTYEGDSLAAVPFRLPGPVPEIGMITRRSWMPTALHESFTALLARRMAGAHVPRLVEQVG